MRGSLAARIWPNPAELTVEIGLFVAVPLLLTWKFVWLKMLKNSPRTSTDSLSLMGKFLKIPMSQLKKPGPKNSPLPTLPNFQLGGSENAEEFSHVRQEIVTLPQLLFLL
jgi:hypothetical protein